MIDKQLEKNFQNVFIAASSEKCRLITVEALLRELLSNGGVYRVLDACGCDIARLRCELDEFVRRQVPKLSGPDDEPQPSVGFQRVVESAMMHVQQSERADVLLHGEDLLVAIFDEPESWAVSFLTEQGVTKLKVTEWLCRNGFAGGPDSPCPEGGEEEEDEAEADDGAGESPCRGAQHRPPRSRSALESFTVNLNEKAKKGGLDPLVGREEEIRRMIQILCRRRKNNPLLVGEAGVGKTALAEGLAERIASSRVPCVLRNRVVRSLSLGGLVAGTKYRGDFEARIKALLDEVKAHPETILFIDEIHSVIGAGSSSNSQSLDAADLFKPALSDGSLSCIGATTYDEYRRIFEKDHAFSRRFQKVDVKEPSEEETFEILKGLRGRFEKFHGIAYSEEALRAAVKLSQRYISDRRLPDKAIDVIDEAGAAQRLLAPGDKPPVIGPGEIAATVSAMARVPVDAVSAGEAGRLKSLGESIRRAIYGQDEAVDAVVSAIRLSRSGLGGHDRPVGSFLFTGPTGVGKTELARQLARALGVELIRFDMSEYAEPHSVSRLIGAPPGYVGFEQGGLLTDAVAKQPYAVVLLDEIEKAHPDIYNVLLQVMDHGSLTDNNGRHADFRNVILIMTSNAGARLVSRNVIGFGEAGGAGDDTAEINRIFPPEFRNRLDAIVRFHPLAGELIAKIVDKLLAELSERLAAKKVRAVFTPALRSFLAEKGVDPRMGARPMRRLVQDRVERLLADELLFGRLQKGGFVTVGFQAGEVTLRFPQEGGAAPSVRAKKALRA
ncbi:MAG: AAA family ATPase [Mesosutterella sp.]|nr:AAA family ATPase [Mesosutterella sp.]